MASLTETYAGATVTLTVDLDDQVQLTPGEQARLSHHMDLVMRSMLRRYIHHVTEWEERCAILRRLTLREAEVLGLSRVWHEVRRT